VNLSGGATSLVLKFDNFEAAPAFAAGIEEKVQDVAEISALRVRSWGELAPDVETFMKLKLGGTYVFTLVFTLVVAVIVANVVTMAVLERTREYGVRLALGESPSRLMASVYIESLLLAVVASIVGCISGGALVTWYGKVGLDMGVGQMETAGVILTGILYPKATTTGYLFALVSVLVFSLVGTIYPALRIRRIRVMDALYFS
jgi:ABC-type antimicrobial peptide transport system permease subunit